MLLIQGHYIIIILIHLKNKNNYSPALGQGWRLGFLGLLHLEVFCQRLYQEYGTESILTAPSVTYKIKLKPTKQNIKDGSDIVYINNPVHFPDYNKIEEYFEPMVIGK